MAVCSHPDLPPSLLCLFVSLFLPASFSRPSKHVLCDVTHTSETASRQENPSVRALLALPTSPTESPTRVCKPAAQKQTQMEDVEQTQHMFFHHQILPGLTPRHTRGRSKTSPPPPFPRPSWQGRLPLWAPVNGHPHEKPVSRPQNT